MKKNIKVIEINGLRGILAVTYAIICAVAGFLFFPAWALMSIWNYFMIDLSPDSIRVVIVCTKQAELNKVIDDLRTDTTINFETDDFTVNEFSIENANSDV